MDSDYLLRKLEPLIPDKVRHWRRVRDTADAETNTLIDRTVAETAYQLLGDFREKILLSLPPEHRSKGAINLGSVVYDKPRWPFGISSSELLQNLAIFGRSGAGKTNTVFHLVQQLSERNIPWLFWDWKRTVRHLIPKIRSPVRVLTPGRALSALSFNPFIVPPGMEANVYIIQLVDIMASAFTLGDGARSVLQKAIGACYSQGLGAPTVGEIKTELEKQPSNIRSTGWKISATRALDSIAFADVAGTTGSSQQEAARSLLQSQTIIELDALADSTKQFLIPVLSLWLYSVRLASPSREKLSLVLIIEEAHHVLYKSEQRSRESVMNRLLRQCREIGIGIVVVDQHPHLISSAALGNTYTSICLNLKDPSDINRAAALSQVADDEKSYFSRLPVGYGIVKLQDRWRTPLLVHFDLVDVSKGSVTDELLKKIINRSLKPPAIRSIMRGQTRLAGHVGTGDRYLSEEEFRFLHDVLRHTEDGVITRYKRLGFSGRRGFAVKEGLLNRGWLIDEIVGNEHTALLRIPEKAQEILGNEVKDIPESTVKHEYWKRHYAALFADRGYTVEVEAERKGGRVDVLAMKEGERVGIEIETGKSDVVSNVKHCLESRFSMIIVVATDDNALRIVERQLAVAGLLIPNRVRVVLRDGLELIE